MSNQDNEWATPPPSRPCTKKLIHGRNASIAATRHRLATEYIRALADYQVKISALHFGRTATKLGRWATSSHHRWNFTNIMTVAKNDNQGYTISALAEEMQASRTAVHRIVQDALAEGWVEKTGRSKYQATDYVLEASHDYLASYLAVTAKCDVVKIAGLYRNFVEVMNV